MISTGSRLTHRGAGDAGGDTRPIPPPAHIRERLAAGFLRGFLRVCFRPFTGPPWPIAVQRPLVRALSLLTPGIRRVSRHRTAAGAVPVEVTAPRRGEVAGVVLYLHGGAFCLGSAATHRGITSRLSVYGQLLVWTPDYRLAPEHPFPAALDDACACYSALIEQGRRPEEIVVAGDSAGGSLALALALRLRERGMAMPACLLLLSPVTDAELGGASIRTRSAADPMIRRGWLEQALAWYRCPPAAPVHQPLQQELHGLPPMLIQVGEQEILLDDSTRLAEHARRCGVEATLEIYQSRWHVFQLQALYLQSAEQAIRRLAGFARRRLSTAAGLGVLGGSI